MPRRSKPKTRILWNKTNDQIRQKWNSIFQSKAKDFDNKWILYYGEGHPDLKEDWEEPLVESLEITFKCKECDYIWTLSEGFVHLFFRLSDVTNETDTKGEVLVFLQDEKCPSCSTTTIPEMDVPGSEMNAVLSYLTMEIGWYYYHINYTKAEEKRVEKSRLRKIEPSKKKGRGKKVQITNNPTSEIPNNASAKNPAVEPKSPVEPKKKKPHNPDDESWAASSPGPSPVPENVKNPRSKSKKTKKATEKQGTTDNAATAGLASTPLPRRNNPNRESSETANNNSPGRKKKPSRWNKTSEEIQRDWQLIFDYMFEPFITETNPDDKWTFDLENLVQIEQVNKKLNATKRRFSKTFTVLTAFRCATCTNTWESIIGRVSFTVFQNDRRSDGKLQGGHVSIFINGQKCLKCPAVRNDDYEKGNLNEDAMEYVLSKLLRKIEKTFYGIESEGVGKEPHRRWNPKSGHKESLCQACDRGNCKKKRQQLNI